MHRKCHESQRQNGSTQNICIRPVQPRKCGHNGNRKTGLKYSALDRHAALEVVMAITDVIILTVDAYLMVSVFF
jgi:hypothetical protein